MIRVSLADDRHDVRQNFARILECCEDFELLWSVDDGEAAVKRIQTERPLPDVLLMDIEMRQMNGIEATRRIHALQPDIRIVMLTVFEDEDNIFAAIRAGAAGYLLKDEPPAALYQSIHDAHAGRIPMSPLVARKALELLRTAPAPASPQPADFGLSEREVDILRHLAGGLTYKVIAKQLFLSPHTVRSHTERIYRKLKINSKVEASNLVSRHRWV